MNAALNLCRDKLLSVVTSGVKKSLIHEFRARP